MPSLSDIVANIQAKYNFTPQYITQPQASAVNVEPISFGGGAVQQQAQAASPIQAMQNDYQEMFGQPVNASQGQWREMTGLERALAHTQEASEKLTGLTGWNPEEGFTPGNIVKFAAGLPFQMAGGALEGVGSGYEAITGKPIRDNPWTEQSEVDLERNQILDYDLSAQERISSGVNAAIDFGGLGMGGSGRLLGAAGKAASAGRVGENMAVGMFGRAMNTPAGRIGGQMAFDSAEEAAEEFGQSYLDDIRWNHVDQDSFGRAVQGAQWGALGGGMMSGAGHAINYGVNKYRGRSSNESGPAGEQPKQTEIQDPTVPYSELRESSGSLEGMDQTNAYRRDKMGGSQRYVDGSVNVKHAGANTDIFFNDIDISDEAIIASYDSSIASRRAIENKFGATEQEFNAAIRPDSNGQYSVGSDKFNTAAEALTALKTKKLGNRNLRVGIGRNPDTKNGGFYVNVRNITHGGDLIAHPMVYAITGSDIDGDTSTVYFDTSKTNFMGYASDMFAHPEGASNVDWYFSGIGYGTTRNSIDRTFKQVLGNYTRKADNGQNMDKYYADQFDKAVQMKDDGERNKALSTLFMKMQSDIRSMNDAKEYEGHGINSHRAMDLIIKDLSRPMHETFEEAKEAYEGVFSKALAQSAETESQKEAIRDMCVTARGSLGENESSPVQLYDYLGLLNYSLTGKGNLTYRQYGELYYASKDVKAFRDAVTEMSKYVDDNDIFSTLIRASFRMVQSGVSPTTAIEGMIDSFTLTKTLGQFGDNSRLRTQNDVDKLFDIFRKNYNEYVKVYNDAEKALTKNGFEPIGDKVQRNRITDDTEGEQQLIRMFNKIFSNVPVETIFDLDDIGYQHEGKTLSQYLKPLAENPGRAKIEVIATVPEIQKTINRLVGNYNTEIKAVESRVSNIVNSVKLNSLKARLEKGGKLDVNDHAAFAAYVDGLAMVIDPDIAIEAGLFGEEILNTRIGRMLVSNNLNDRLNALIGISMHTQFAPLIEGFNSEDEEIRSRAIEVLQDKAQVSEIHSLIVSQIMDKKHGGYSELLNLIIDLDESYESKLDMIKRRQEAGEVFHPSTNLLVDCLRTESSDFDLSSMGARVRKADVAFTKSVKMMYEKDRAEVASLKKKLQTNGVQQNQFVSYFKDCCQHAYAQFNLDILGMQVYSATTMANSAVEKGVIQPAASNAMVSLDYIFNGAPRSYLHQLTGEKFDSATIDEFAANRQWILKLMSDENFEMHVFDPTSGDDVIVTQEMLFKSVYPDYDSSVGLTNDIIIALLERFPQLVGYLAHSQPQPGMAEGMATTTLARTKSFEDGFVDWCSAHGTADGRVDSLVNWNRERAKREISNILLNKTWYRGYLIRCIDDIESKLSPGQLTKEMTRLHHQTVNAFFSASQYDSDSNKLNVQKEAYFNLVAADNVSDIFEAVNAANDHLADIMIDSTMSVNLMHTVSEKINNQIFLNEVKSKLKNAGYDVSDIEVDEGFIDTSGVSDAFNQRIEDASKNLRVIASLIAKVYSGNLDVVQSSLDSGFITQVNDIAQKIVDDQNKKNGVKTDPKFINRIIDESRQNITNAIDETITDDSILLKSDNTKDIITEKVKNIAKQIGSTITDKEINKEVNSLFKDDGTIKVDDYTQYMISWNNQYFSDVLQKISRTSNVDINTNFYRASQDTVDAINSTLADIRREVDYTWDSPEIMDDNTDSKVLKLPIPKFNNSVTEAIVNQMRNMDNAGHVPTAVSINGGMTKQQAGFGFLPRDRMNEIPPRELTYPDLISDPNFKNMGNWKCSLDVPAENISDLRTVDGLFGQQLTKPQDWSNRKIYLYDPDLNVHGVSSSNSTATINPAADGYLRLPGILGLILDYSQEGMVLKAKKTLIGRDEIVSKRGGATTKFDVDKSVLGNSVTAREEMTKVFMSARRGYADELNKTFKKGGDLDKLGFNYDQARILAQGLTVGMRVTTSDGGIHIIDARHFFTDQKDFDARWNQITNNGELQITTASVRFATPTEISYRIMRNVSKEFHSKENPTKKDTENAAWEAMCNWDTFQSGNLDIGKIIARTGNVGYAHSGGLVAPDTPTPFQYLVDHEFNGGFGAMAPRPYNDDVFKKQYNINDSRYQTAIAVTNKLDYDGSATITQVFMDKRNKTMAGFINVSQFKNLIGWDTRIVPGGSMNTAALVLSSNKIDSAIKWGKETGGLLYVHPNLEKYLPSNLSVYSYSGTITIDNEEYIVLNPAKGEFSKRYINNNPTSKFTPLETNEITGAMVDINNLIGPGDAQILGSSSMMDLQTTDARAVTYKPSNYLGDYGRQYTLASRDKLVQLRNDVANGDWSHFDFRSLKDKRTLEDVAKNDVRVFLDGINAKAKGTDGILRSNVGHGDVVAMVTDGVNFAPIYLPDTAVRKVDALKIDIFGNNLTMGWSGKFSMDSVYNEMIKIGLDGEAFKGEMQIRDDVYYPKVLNGNANVDMIISADTQKSRAYGKDTVFAIRDAWYAFKKFGEKEGWSLLYDINDDRVELKKHIVDAFGGDISVLKDFEKGIWYGAWDQVISGRVNLADTKMTNTEQENANRVIRDVVLACRTYHINPIYVLSPFARHTDIAKGANGRSLNRDINFFMVLGNLNKSELATLFNAIDNRIVPAPGVKADGHFFDQNFNTRILDKEGNAQYIPVRWGVHKAIGDQSGMRIPGEMSKYAYQHVYRRGLDMGYLDQELGDIIEYADMMLNNTEYLKQRTLAKTLKDRKQAAAIGFRPKYDTESTLIDLVRNHPNDTWLTIKHREAVLARGNNMHKIRDVIDNGEKIDNPMSNHKIAQAMENLRKAAGMRVSYEFASIEAARQTGYTWLENGVNEVDVDKLASSINDIANSVREVGIPVRNLVRNGRPLDDRFALPRLIPEEVDVWWRSPTIQAKWSSREAFDNAITEEARKAYEQVQQIEEEHRAKKIALNTAFEYDFEKAGVENPPDGYLIGNTYISDIIDATDRLGEAMRQGYEGGVKFDVDLWNEMTARERQILVDIRDAVNQSKNVRNFSIENTNGGVGVIIERDDGKTMTALLNNATELSKIMALINPGVLVSNLIDRGFHQGIMNASLHLGHILHVGPYKGKHWIDQDTVTKAINDPLFMELYVAYRQAGFSGQEMEFLANAQSSEQIKGWLAERKKNMTPYQKACERIYDISAGGNKMIKNQMRNFINRFVMFAEQNDGLQFWFEDVGGVSLIENQLNQNAGKWFVDILGGNKGNTASLTAALQAMNSAKQGDMAQRNVISMMYAEIARKSPLCKFLVTTTISRFPQYSLNVTGRMLNWVLPMSSINYVFTEKMANMAHKKAEKSEGKYADPHYEMAQIHTSLREAMLVDITHLGVGAVAMILLGMSGGIQPPEDEHKWGNPDEWIICGMRLGEAWWIEDILGVALPLATFAKSAQLGKPRIDLLFNGLSQVCYNNPMVRVADAVGWLLDPEGSFFTDYQEDYERYQNAADGPPSLTDWMQASAVNFGLSWASQFFTPSVVREWYRNAQQWEASYKNVYTEGVTGKLTEGGQQGDVMPTTYGDAMLRRTTRRNPMLGWLCDMVIHPETGYMWHEMPYVTYRDDAQIAEMEKWSIEGLSDVEAQAKCLDIIYYMNQYDDMNELRATGFYLDYPTRAAISSVVWDTINELDTWYYGLQADGKLDAYYLGNGDFQAGLERKAEITLAWKEQKAVWSDFYYDKVRSDALNEPIVTYRRYNTTYAKDDTGEYYATGFRPQGVLPFISAPGRIGAPENTAGYENDWATVSAVTGEPMNQRALVPWTMDSDSWPSLEYWSADGNGNGYSELYQMWYGTTGTTSSTTGTPNSPTSLSNKELYDMVPSDETGGTTTKKNSGGTTSGGSSTRRSGGGGGGGRSGGGGGGGSSRGSANSRFSPANLSTPKTMNHTNLDRSNLDYLRPGWETKGSREAYRREDI